MRILLIDCILCVFLMMWCLSTVHKHKTSYSLEYLTFLCNLICNLMYVFSPFCLEKCEPAPAEAPILPLSLKRGTKERILAPHNGCKKKIKSIPNKLHHSPAGLSSPLISLLFHPPLVRPPFPLYPLSPFLLLFVSRQQGNGGLSGERKREIETGRQRDSELLLKLWRQLCQECRCLLWGQQSKEDLRRSAAWASSTSV